MCVDFQVIAAAGKRSASLPASFAIDMWSLGAIAYEIFSGCDESVRKLFTNLWHACMEHWNTSGNWQDKSSLCSSRNAFCATCVNCLP